MRDLLRCAADLVLPGECAGCRRVGTALCPACEHVLDQPARPVRPDPLPDGWPTCWSGGEYVGPAARVLKEYKDGDRRDLAPVLGACLGRALDAVLRSEPWLARVAATEGIVVVPVPSAPRAVRQRGDRPVRTLARRALSGLPAHEAVILDALRLNRTVADQGGLGGLSRRRNLVGAMAVRGPALARVAGRAAIVVDDVVTSGSTIAEAVRALRSAGAGSVSAAAALGAVRRHPSPVPLPLDASGD